LLKKFRNLKQTGTSSAKQRKQQASQAAHRWGKDRPGTKVRSGRNIMVELEGFVLVLSIVLEALGVASIVGCTACRRTRWVGTAEVALVGCVCALGSVTMLGAMLHLYCGLVSGLFVVGLGLAAILLTDRAVHEQPATR
jgi:hypothetical protein